MIKTNLALKVMVNDPIADMLTRIRNATARRHRQVQIPVSKIRIKIAELLKETHHINNFELRSDGQFQKLIIDFSYPHGRSKIQGLKRISKPGLRVYAQHQNLPQALNGLGMVMMSTSRGVMTARTARKHKIGGEVLAFVW